MYANLIQFAHRYLIADNPPLPLSASLKSAMGALFGLLLGGAILYAIPGAGLTLLAPMGATAIILFALPHSPLAQPWSVLGGYLMATLSALLAVALVDQTLAASALAVAATAWLMLRLRCVHPPGGALALFIIAEGSRSPSEAMQLIGLVAANALALIVAGFAVNNGVLRRTYPQCQAKPSASQHNTADAIPTARSGLSHADLAYAVRAVGSFVDTQESELVRIYGLAVDHACERNLAVSCGDIMARDIVAVEFGTELEEAWNLLRRHKIKALPVVDSFRRIIGIVTVADFLRQLDDTTAAGLAVKLQGLLRRTPGISSEKAEVVGQVMSATVYTASMTTPVTDLVHRLSDHGLHHIPVVDAERKLVGMVTQSDLIAALYRRVALASV